MRVTHDFHPSPATPNLYEIDVTIENLTDEELGDIRYRRVTDWDVEPTVFSEYVTIQGGGASNLLFDSDHGFATANPLGERPSIAATGDFVDSGPFDHGALFDFGFGALDAGAQRSFTIYYGAAATETAAERCPRCGRCRGLFAGPARHRRRRDARDAEHVHGRLRRSRR